MSINVNMRNVLSIGISDPFIIEKAGHKPRFYSKSPIAMLLPIPGPPSDFVGLRFVHGLLSSYVHIQSQEMHSKATHSPVT